MIKMIYTLTINATRLPHVHAPQLQHRYTMQTEERIQRLE